MESWDKIKNLFNIETTGIITVIFMIALKRISKYLKDNIPFWIDYIIKRTSKNIANIHIALRRCLYRLNCERITLFLFTNKLEINHIDNNIESIHEVLEEGISSTLVIRKRLNVLENLSDLTNKLIDKESIIIRNTLDLSNLLTVAFFSNYNALEVYLRIVYNSKHEPMGFICLETFKKNSLKDDYIETELKKTANKILYLI